MIARENPFATERILRLRYRMPEQAWSRLLDRLHGHEYRGAIVGPRGSGKTTLLEDLGPRLERLGFDVLLRRHDPASPTGVRRDIRWLVHQVGRDTVVLFDGADSLGRTAWWCLRQATRRVAGLVITVHDAGRLPEVHRCAPSLEVLEHLVRELVGDDARRLRGLVRRLYLYRGGNIRDVLRDLYEAYASDRARPSWRPGTVGLGGLTPSA